MLLQFLNCLSVRKLMVVVVVVWFLKSPTVWEALFTVHNSNLSNQFPTIKKSVSSSQSLKLIWNDSELISVSRTTALRESKTTRASSPPSKCRSSTRRRPWPGPWRPGRGRTPGSSSAPPASSRWRRRTGNIPAATAAKLWRSEVLLYYVQYCYIIDYIVYFVKIT